MNTFLRLNLILLLSLTFFFTLPLCAANQSYQSRPKVEEVPNLSFKEPPPNWGKTLAGLHRAVIELVAFYPNRDIYFLARDGEFLYDMAKSVFTDSPAVLKKLHLINVSRKNMNSEKLYDYLAQEGLSTKQTAVLVDNGFIGTIPNKILSTLKVASHDERIKTHMLVSKNGSIPSSRVFMDQFSTLVGRIPIEHFHGVLLNFEMLPHFTKTSTFVENVDGRWEATSSLQMNPEEQQESITAMAEIRSYAINESQSEVAKKQYHTLSMLYHLAVDKKSPTTDEIIEVALQINQLNLNNAFLDLEEMAKTKNIRVEPQRFELLRQKWPTKLPWGEAPSRSYAEDQQRKKQTLKEYSDVAEFLTNPSQNIRRLNRNDREIILRIIDSGDREVHEAIIKQLLSKKGWESEEQILLNLAQWNLASKSLSELLGTPRYLKNPTVRKAIVWWINTGETISQRYIIINILKQLHNDPDGANFVRQVIANINSDLPTSEMVSLLLMHEWQQHPQRDQLAVFLIGRTEAEGKETAALTRLLISNSSYSKSATVRSAFFKHLFSQPPTSQIYSSMDLILNFYATNKDLVDLKKVIEEISSASEKGSSNIKSYLDSWIISLNNASVSQPLKCSNVFKH